MITGWGFSPNKHLVHYYDEVDGLPICRWKELRTGATIPLPRWDPNHEKTCARCKRIVEIIQEQDRTDTAIGKTSGCEQ